MEGEAITGSVPDGWNATTLGEIVKQGGGHIQTGPFGSQLHASDYVPVGVPSIMPVNIGDNQIIEEGIARITETDAERLSRHRVQAGDIIYSRRGDVERRALIRPGQEGWLCGTGCLKVRLGNGDVDPRFVSYYLGHPGVRAWILRHAIGATMPNLNTSIMRAIPLLVPPLEEQLAIACILGTLDDKIELNRRMNETLEGIAQAIFKSWFVDFDPVRAKMNGQQPSGLAPHIADLFPDAFEASELGEIPKGWHIRPIGDVVQVFGGGTPSTKEPTYWEGGIHPFCTPKDMSSLTSPILLGTERHLTDEGLAKISSGQLPMGTVLLSSRAPIGYLAIAETHVSVNQGIIAMICDREIPNLYILNWTRANMDRIIANANGSTFLEISKRNFRPIKALAPPKDILDQFCRIAEPLYRRIVGNLKQMQVLAIARDTLLPKLISGEIQLSERKN